MLKFDITDVALTNNEVIASFENDIDDVCILSLANEKHGQRLANFLDEPAVNAEASIFYDELLAELENRIPDFLIVPEQITEEEADLLIDNDDFIIVDDDHHELYNASDIYDYIDDLIVKYTEYLTYAIALSIKDKLEIAIDNINRNY